MDAIKEPKRILIIDDSELDRIIIERVLKKADLTKDIETECAENGKVALDMLSQSAKSGKDFPDLISLDINMPIMNGIEFLEAYKEKNYHKDFQTIFLFALSSTQDKGDIQKIMSSDGVRLFVEKPLTINKLEKILNEHFSKP